MNDARLLNIIKVIGWYRVIKQTQQQLWHFRIIKSLIFHLKIHSFLSSPEKNSFVFIKIYNVFIWADYDLYLARGN